MIFSMWMRTGRSFELRAANSGNLRAVNNNGEFTPSIVLISFFIWGSIRRYYGD